MITIAMAGQTLTLAGLVGILRVTGKFNIFIQAHTGDDLILQLQQAATLPDICIIGAKPEGINALAVAEQIHKKWSGLKTIVLTSLDRPVSLMFMKQCGVKAYVIPTCCEEDFIETIDLVAHGYCYYPPHLALQLDELVKNRKRNRNGHLFSPKELTVISLLCGQHTPKEIAYATGGKLSTVNTNLNRIKQKLQVSTNQELLVLLQDAGLDMTRTATCR